VARIKDILTDFLTSEQIEKGEKDNNPQLLNIIDFMNSTIDEINILYDTNNVKYLHKSKNNNVSIDEHLLKTSITNLIVNAIKYSEKELPIIITSTITNTNKFSIKIKDAGIGIPAINQPNIFNKFYRGNNTGNVGGTGLGLHITKKLVNLMGGNLTFTSKINKGTIFKISFP
jgi:signal transduction histidine kinase